MTLSPASDLKTRQMVWVRNLPTFVQLDSVTWASIGRKGLL